MSRIKITGDTTIDLSKELLNKYNVKTVPLYIVRGENSSKDGKEVTPEDIYAYVSETKKLPKTSAPSVQDYIDCFTELKKEYDEIIHFNISSEFSSAYQNAVIAANEVGGVYPVDSRNLSTGTGLLVIEACEEVEKGEKTAKEIAEEMSKLTEKVEASFIINQLDYLYKGGRCSGVAALGANMLKLRPVILVQNGKMNVGKKYRGKYTECVKQYIKETLENRDDIRNKRIFITHTKCDEETLKIAHDAVAEFGNFEEILDTTAGCTITTHCGAGTLGVLFIKK